MNLITNFSFSFLPKVLSGFATALNCSSPTPKSLFQALEANVFSENTFRPVKSFFEPLNITVDITVVEILGVVSVHRTVFLLSTHYLFLIHNRYCTTASN